MQRHDHRPAPRPPLDRDVNTVGAALPQPERGVEQTAFPGDSFSGHGRGRGVASGFPKRGLQEDLGRARDAHVHLRETGQNGGRAENHADGIRPGLPLEEDVRTADVGARAPRQPHQ